MIETITIKHNRASLEAWHGDYLVTTSEGVLLSGIISPVMSYASSLNTVKAKVIYKRPSGPNGKTSPATLYEHNSDMNYRVGAQPWINWRPAPS